MVITFNGDYSQAGYERLELMCFNESNKTFEFRDIAFPGEAKSPEELEDIPTHLRTKPFVISPVNGHPNRDCKMCHMTPARPNWQPYDLWPGICGADGDEYYIRRFDGSGGGNKGPNYLDSASVEKKGCDQFFEQNFKTGRYGSLRPFEMLTNQLEPNFALGVLLNRLNGERIVEEWKRRGKPVYEMRYQIAEALFCNFPKYLDDGKPYHQKNLMPRPLDPLALDFLRSNMTNYKNRILKTSSSLGKSNIITQEDKTERSAAAFFSSYYGISASTPLERKALVDAAHSPFEPLALAQLSRLFKPHGFDVSNWSQVPLGGHSFRDGLNGMHGDSLLLMLEKPFSTSFLPEETRIHSLINKLHTSLLEGYGQNDYKQLTGKEVVDARQEMCDIVRPKAEIERKRGGGQVERDENPTMSTESEN